MRTSRGTSGLLGAAVAAVAALAVVGGCAGAPAGDGGTTAPEEAGSAEESAPAAPSDLVGLWRVDAEGEAEDTWLQVGSSGWAGELTLWRECGTLSGSWVARSGSVLAALDGGHDACLDDDATVAVPWLDAATGYAVDGGTRTLLDADGAVLATLSVDGEPPAHPDVADEYRAAPELDEEALAALDAAPAPLPDGLEPATASDVVGRWVPAQAFETEPFVELAEDGTWTGSDGCNGTAGRWTIAADGSLLATSGPSTLMACDGVPVGSALAASAWLVLDGDTLQLYDAAGEPTVDLVRG